MEQIKLDDLRKQRNRERQREYYRKHRIEILEKAKLKRQAFKTKEDEKRIKMYAYN